MCLMVSFMRNLLWGRTDVVSATDTAPPAGPVHDDTPCQPGSLLSVTLFSFLPPLMPRVFVAGGSTISDTQRLVRQFLKHRMWCESQYQHCALVCFVPERKTACTTLWPTPPSWRCRPWWPLNLNTSWLLGTPWKRLRPSVSGKPPVRRAGCVTHSCSSLLFFLQLLQNLKRVGLDNA